MNILDQTSNTTELKLALEIVFRRIKALTQDKQIDLVNASAPLTREELARMLDSKLYYLIVSK